MMNKKIGLILSAALTVALAASVASACAIPVFRYALLNWPADNFRVVVFHRGPLAGQDLAAAKLLISAQDSDTIPANLTAETVDVSQTLTPDLQTLFKSLSPPSLPWMVVLWPDRLNDPQFQSRVFWSGRLTNAAATGLIHSPKRTELADRLLKGDSIVWVFLESGDKAKDDKAAGELSDTIKKLEGMLMADLSNEKNAAPTDDAFPPDPDTEPVNIAFSVLRVSPNDAAEEFFIRMLKTIAAQDGGDVTLPAVFPVYGRGRALGPMAGDDLKPRRISDVAEFLSGDCSCIIKAEHPGLDLLIAANWDTLQLAPNSTAKPLPLTGVMPGAAATSQGNSAASGAKENPLPSIRLPGGNVLWATMAALAVAAGVVAIIARRLSRKMPM